MSSEARGRRKKRSAFHVPRRAGHVYNHTLEHRKRALAKSESVHTFKPTVARVWAQLVPLKDRTDVTVQEQSQVNTLYDGLHKRKHPAYASSPHAFALPAPSSSSASQPNFFSSDEPMFNGPSSSSSSSFVAKSSKSTHMARSKSSFALRKQRKKKEIRPPRGAQHSGIANPRELERYETTKSAVARHDANVEQVGFALSLRLLGNDVQQRLQFLDEHQGDPILERRRNEDTLWQKEFFWDHLHTISNTLNAESSYEKHNSVSEAAMLRRKCDAIAHLNRDAQQQAYENAAKQQEKENKAFDDRFSWRKELQYAKDLIHETDKHIRAEKVGSERVLHNKWQNSEAKVAEFSSTGHVLFLPFEKEVADLHLKALKVEQRVVQEFDQQVKDTAQWHQANHKRLEQDIGEMRKVEEEKIKLEHKRQSCDAGTLRVMLRRVDGMNVPAGVKADVAKDAEIPISMRMGFHLKQVDVDGNEDEGATIKYFSRMVTGEQEDGSQWFNQKFDYDVARVSSCKLLVTCEVLPFDNVRRSDANDESEVPGLTGLQAVHSTVIDESDMNNDWQDDDESRGLSYKATSSPMFAQLVGYPLKFDKWLRDGFTHVLSSFEITMSDIRHSRNGKLKRSWIEFCGGKIQLELQLVPDFASNVLASPLMGNRVSLGQRRRSGLLSVAAGDIFGMASGRGSRRASSSTTARPVVSREKRSDSFTKSHKNPNNANNMRSSKRLSGKRRLSVQGGIMDVDIAAAAAAAQSKQSEANKPGLSGMMISTDALLIDQTSKTNLADAQDSRSGRRRGYSGRRRASNSEDASIRPLSPAQPEMETPRDLAQPTRGSLRVNTSREGRRPVELPAPVPGPNGKLSAAQLTSMFPGLVTST